MNDLTDRLITRINELEARLSRLESSDRKLGDIQMTLGDTAGANKLSLRDSTPAEVFAVDSDGKVITELVVTGTTSSTAKAFDNFRIGIEAGTPRITIEDNSYTQWQIDNSLGQFRIFNRRGSDDAEHIRESCGDWECVGSVGDIHRRRRCSTFFWNGAVCAGRGKYWFGADAGE